MIITDDSQRIAQLTDIIQAYGVRLPEFYIIYDNGKSASIFLSPAIIGMIRDNDLFDL